MGGAAQPPLFAAISSASKGSVNAVGIAFVSSVGTLGAFLGPVVVGQLIDSRGLAVACAVAATAIALGACLVLMVRPAHREPAIPSSQSEPLSAS